MQVFLWFFLIVFNFPDWKKFAYFLTYYADTSKKDLLHDESEIKILIDVESCSAQESLLWIQKCFLSSSHVTLVNFPFASKIKRTSSFVPCLRTTTYYKMDSVHLIYQCNYYPFLPFLRKVAVVASYVCLQQQYLQVAEAPLLMSVVFAAYLRLLFNAMLLNQYDWYVSKVNKRLLKFRSNLLVHVIIKMGKWNWIIWPFVFVFTSLTGLFVKKYSLQYFFTNWHRWNLQPPMALYILINLLNE